MGGLTMKRIRSKPPSTRNPEAAALIDLAQQKCEGCRTAWRLKDGKHYGVFRAAGGKACTAPTERQALAALAFAGQRSPKT